MFFLHEPTWVGDTNLTAGSVTTPSVHMAQRQRLYLRAGFFCSVQDRGGPTIATFKYWQETEGRRDPVHAEKLLTLGLKRRGELRLVEGASEDFCYV